MPFLLQWSGHLPSGVDYDKPVISLDVYGTAAAVAEHPIPQRRPIDGVNLFPFLSGDNDGMPHRELFWRLSQRTAIRVGDWKLLKNPQRRSGKEATWELYNLAEDISESNDLAAKEPGRVSELVAAWTRLNDEMVDPIWTPQK